VELQRKRQLLVGDGADPVLSTTVIDILFTRGYLDEKDTKGEVIPDVARERHEAAKRYRRLRCAVYGSPWPGNAVGHDVSETHLAKLRQDAFERHSLRVPIRPLKPWNPASFDTGCLPRALSERTESIWDSQRAVVVIQTGCWIEEASDE
jgi:hypothetical protein